MKTYLEPEDVQSMEEAATCPRDRLLIRLLFRLGCRVSEALGIAVSDVDFEQGTVVIQHLKRRIAFSCPHCKASLAKAHSFCPGCGTKIGKSLARERERRRLRTLPLDGDMLKMLKDHVESGGPVYRNGKMVIFGINRHQAWRVVRECATRAGIGALVNPETGKTRGVSPHRLRDAFAVHAVRHDDSGDGLRMLQEHLGHASFNTTARYRKVASGEHRKWYERLWR